MIFKILSTQMKILIRTLISRKTNKIALSLLYHLQKMQNSSLKNLLIIQQKKNEFIFSCFNKKFIKNEFETKNII